MNKIQQNKGAHVKSKPLTPWLHVWAYRKNSDRKLALLLGAPRSVAPRPLPIVDPSQLCKPRSLPFMKDSSAPTCRQHHKGQGDGGTGS